MGEEDFFYYREDFAIFIYQEPNRRARHGSHLWAEDYEEEEMGHKKARVYLKKEKDELIYYVEMPGVNSPEDIEIELEGRKITVKGKLKKVIITPSLRKNVEISEYRADIDLPFDVEPEDIRTEFYRSRSLLVIRIKKSKKKFRISINDVY